VLRGAPPSIDAELIRPEERGLSGTPAVAAVAGLCLDLAAQAGARLIVIDGPQGWRAPGSPVEGKRVCERCTHTPGKTGDPGVVTPKTWTRMAMFSIELFDALHAAGWPRFSGEWPAARATIESFPTQGWRRLGFPPLPGSRRRKLQLKTWMGYLTKSFGVRWSRDPSHDELQAVVVGLGGLLLLREGVTACDVHGHKPFVENGVWREGYILGPRAGAIEPCRRCAGEEIV